MKTILHSFAYALDYLREQVADVSPADMVTIPNGVANHPAWVIGHLTHTCQMIGGVVGLGEWLPRDWAKRFGTDSTPISDANAYEIKNHALAMLTDAQGRVMRAVAEVTDAQLDQPFPDPAFRDVFPTVRHALTQVLVGHTSMHVGQITVWRRAMGLAKMRRSFE